MAAATSIRSPLDVAIGGHRLLVYRLQRYVGCVTVSCPCTHCTQVGCSEPDSIAFVKEEDSLIEEAIGCVHFHLRVDSYTYLLDAGCTEAHRPAKLCT